MTTTFVITDSTDKVLRLQTSNSSAPPVLKPGETATETAAVFPGWPSIEGKILTFVNGVYLEIDPRSVLDLKAAKNEEINKARLAANQATFPFGGKNIACDPLSRSDIDGVNGIVSLTGALPNNFPMAWKAVDNSYVSIPDKNTWVSFYAAMVNQGVANFTKSQQLKAQLNSAADPDQIDVISWVS